MCSPFIDPSPHNRGFSIGGRLFFARLRDYMCAGRIMLGVFFLGGEQILCRMLPPPSINLSIPLLLSCLHPLLLRLLFGLPTFLTAGPLSCTYLPRDKRI